MLSFIRPPSFLHRLGVFAASTHAKWKAAFPGGGEPPSYPHYMVAQLNSLLFLASGTFLLTTCLDFCCPKNETGLGKSVSPYNTKMSEKGRTACLPSNFQGLLLPPRVCFLSLGMETFLLLFL